LLRTDVAVRGVQKYLKENPDASASDISEVVINEQMASALKSHEKIHIFVRAVITSDFFKNKEIQKYAPTIVKITQKNPIMERHLIAAIEGLCVDMGKIKLFPVMIKQLFDEDALQEDVILEWAVDEGSEYTLDSVDEDNKAKLRAEADPLVNWLEEDSDDDSEDSDSDSE
jgi:translation initiation factor 5